MTMLDEGNGGITRRVVFGPGDGISSCQAYPEATNNLQGQQAGVTYNDKVFVLFFAVLARKCVSMYSINIAEPSANGTAAKGGWKANGGNAFDFPTGLYMNWTSSSGASGDVEYYDGYLIMFLSILNLTGINSLKEQWDDDARRR